MRSVISMIFGCRPPMEPLVANERIKTLGCVYQSLILILSPKTAPRLNGDEGSIHRTPTLFPKLTNKPINESTKVLLPAPGGPVIPIIFAGEDGNDCSRAS